MQVHFKKAVNALYCYNNADLLPEILTRFMQRNDNWICVIIDDGSTDTSAAVIKKFVDQDERFRYVFQQHRGKAIALETAKNVCESKDIVFLDAGADTD